MARNTSPLTKKFFICQKLAHDRADHSRAKQTDFRRIKIQITQAAHGIAKAQRHAFRRRTGEVGESKILRGDAMEDASAFGQTWDLLARKIR